MLAGRWHQAHLSAPHAASGGSLARRRQPLPLSPPASPAAEMVLGAASRLSQAGRSGLLVECNNKKGLGVTLRGTRR